ncbi:hypothetical protein [uncultured Gammaproteobacteria bacterium]|nr:hypothetical protein [uncultured Gammaproteobacteria bacterium]
MGVNGEKEGLQTLPYLETGRSRGYKFLLTCGGEEGLQTLPYFWGGERKGYKPFPTFGCVLGVAWLCFYDSMG